MIKHFYIKYHSTLGICESQTDNTEMNETFWIDSTDPSRIPTLLILQLFKRKPPNNYYGAAFEATTVTWQGSSYENLFLPRNNSLSPPPTGSHVYTN